jgi:hypothetical protein
VAFGDERKFVRWAGLVARPSRSLSRKKFSVANGFKTGGRIKGGSFNKPKVSTNVYANVDKNVATPVEATEAARGAWRGIK